MNRFMFHSLEFIKQDEICIFGAWGDYTIEVTINSDGVDVSMPDFDNDDPIMQVSVRKIFKEEFLSNTGEEQ
tara:strand:- start:793 stop:1008 length:216 start_codon:yes stop_codon:yes gene_type:complete